MAVRYAEWRPDSVLARCVSCGAGAGALAGFALPLVLFLLSAAASDGAVSGGVLGVAFVVLVIGLGFGAVIGMACGLVAFIPLLAAGQCDRSRAVSPAGRPLVWVRPGRASLCAGGGAALLPAFLAAVEAAHHAMGWATISVFAGAVALAAGLILGPHLMYGKARKWPARDLDCAGD